MKKFLVISTTILLRLTVPAQDYTPVKNLAALQQYRQAKDEFDKRITDPVYASKPEAYILKAFIYGGLAMDEKIKNTDEAWKLLTDADAAYRKYKGMDPLQKLLADPVYQNSPINIYSGYYVSGYADYTAKKYDLAFEKLKKAVEYSDLLIEKKIIEMTLDTNVLVLAGITSENSNHKDEAVKYYSRLADRKLNGDGYESVYRFLITYYYGKKDRVAFEKYKAIGAELYPQSDFFKFDKIDFAVGLATNFDEKLKELESILTTDPNNFKGNEVLGEIIYDALNPKDDKAALPSNATDLEKKMMAAFKKAAVAKPGYENPWLYLGYHFINKAVKVDFERTAFVEENKNQNPPGSLPSKEYGAKKVVLDKRYADALELAREPYENAAAIFAKRSGLTNADKMQYKKAASYLAEIYALKKIHTKGNAADEAKYAAEEKKWNNVWESIR
jgi:hypothetical protein